MMEEIFLQLTGSVVSASAVVQTLAEFASSEGMSSRNLLLDGIKTMHTLQLGIGNNLGILKPTIETESN